MEGETTQTWGFNGMTVLYKNQTFLPRSTLVLHIPAEVMSELPLEISVSHQSAFEKNNSHRAETFMPCFEQS